MYVRFLVNYKSICTFHVDVPVIFKQSVIQKIHIVFVFFWSDFLDNFDPISKPDKLYKKSI